MSRLLPGIVMTTAWVLVLAAGPPLLFWLLIFAAALVGLREYLNMALPETGMMIQGIGLTAGMLPIIGALSPGGEYVQAGTFAALLAVIIISLSIYSKLDSGLRFLSLLSFGILYISFCLSQMVLIRFMADGIGWLLVLTAIAAGGDTGAYYVGRSFGRKKLCPHISPGKTVEGAIGGVAAAIICAVVTGLVALPESSPLTIALTALLLSPITIAGDLTESIIKRSTGNKDSGTLLLGHGGVLDRIDSMLLAGPVLYYLLLFGIVS